VTALKTSIHPTAIIEAGAKIGDGATIGPYCVIGSDVELGEGVTLASHVAITGITTIGARTKIAPFASLGTAPQSTGYKGEPTKLIVGSDNDIREHVTMNTGTVADRGVTIVGNGGLFMVGAHIAHDCVVGHNVVFANNATLGGHSVIGDRVVIGGLSACHQHSRIGEGAMVGGALGIREDIIPFGLVGRDGLLAGVNVVGLRRRGATKSDLHAIRHLVQELFLGAGSFEERRASVAALEPDNQFAAIIVDFIRQGGKRPLLKLGRGTLTASAEAE
jgi:UDP-N-acetylglucosamine acyltransferase